MSNTVTSSCATCSNATFDHLWGEYKCGVKHITVRNPLRDCKDYKKGEPATTKEDYSHVYDEE